MARLERFGHGGDLDTAVELYGYAKEELLDFSANIYPYGPPQAIVERLQGLLAEPGLRQLTHYPDPDVRKLRRMIANHHRVEWDKVLVGNGGAELIDLVVGVLFPRQVGVLEPAFVEYGDSARKRGIPVQAVIGCWEDGFVPELAEVERLLERCDLVFVGVPNNPTGHLVPREMLKVWAERAAEEKTWLVLDEAFIDFVEGGEERSLIGLLDRYPTTIVIRSLTKFYALPGLRLGYMVAQPEVIQRIKQQQVPWSVNALAQAAGCVALSAEVYEPYVEEVHAWLRETKQELFTQLASIPSLEVFPGLANYLLVRSCQEGVTSRFLQDELGRRGVLIRDCSMYAGLDERYFRIAVKKREENIVLIEAMKEVLVNEG
jgi:threonine-phosphate decarboxylase